MGFAVHAHPDLARGLHAVQGGNVALGEQAAPRRVGEDHQLGDQLVEGGAALARDDIDVFARDGKVEVQEVGIRARLAALGLKRVGEAPERCDLVFVLQAGLAAQRQQGVERVICPVPQVPGHLHSLEARVMPADGKIACGHIEVNRDRRPLRARVERKGLDNVGGQHGDLLSRHVNGGQPFARNRIEG